MKVMKNVMQRGKFLAAVLVFTLAMSLAACGGKEEGTAKEEPSTPTGMFRADFESRMEAGEGENLEALAQAMVESEWVPFGGAVMPVEPGYLNGFSAEIGGFSEGVFFGPMIGSIPFVGYVFRVDGDVNEFMKNLTETADMRWNVCTQADEMVCDSVGDTVFFVMAPNSFDEE